MKIILLLIITSNWIYSQINEHEISISVGLATSAQYRLVFDDLFQNGDKYNYEDAGRPHQFHLNYYYFKRDSIIYGIYYGYENYPEKIYRNSQHIGLFEEKNHTLAFEYGKRYLNFNWLQVSIGAGIGITYIDEVLTEKEPTDLKTKSKLLFAYHINAVSLRMGYKVYLDLSLGFGYKGLLNLGLSYQF